MSQRLVDDPIQTILVLQGGGALGSYQAGVFEALDEAGVVPQWVAGVSIGAINASLIAGNPPGKRVARLREFWSRITGSVFGAPALALPGWDGLEQKVGATNAMVFGQPGFFRPRAPLDWFGGGTPLSFYDTGDLLATLRELVDFDLINGDGIRISVGAVDVETGNMEYFDNWDMRAHGRRFGPEHVVASGSLPPGFPPMAVGGRQYWDGGLVSNTPLQQVLATRPRRHSLIFQVDLFPARGPHPANLDEVMERQKDITYSSRTRSGTNDAGSQQTMRRQIRRFLEKLPAELRDDPVAKELHEHGCGALIDVAQLIYRPAVPQGSQKDYQFDRGTMERRWLEGLQDARTTLRAAPWKQKAPLDVGFRSFDVTKPHNAA